MTPEIVNLLPFLDCLAAKQPTPGGGSASALGGAIGAALASMAANYTIGAEKYAGFGATARDALSKLEGYRAELVRLVDADMQAYAGYRAAVALPKITTESKLFRSAALAAAREESTRVPEEILQTAQELLRTVLTLSAAVNPNLAGDVASAAYFGEACARSAAIQILANCGNSDAARCARANETVMSCQQMREQIHAAVLAMMGSRT